MASSRKVRCLSSLLVVTEASWFGRDGNFNVRALFEPHVIAMFVRQRAVDAEITYTVVGPINRNLRLFRLARTWRRDNFVDDSGHRGTWLLWNSRGVQF